MLDLTNVLSGPFCTYQLALLGAEVIKIENPEGGDLARELGAGPELNTAKMGASFLAQNAGKKSMTLNLKSEAGKVLFLQLVDTADAVVENFRPGVMERLGLGQEVLRARRPELVYCAISGFGQEGPLRGNPAYDQIIQGMSGVMSITGDADSAPLRAGYPLCDTLGGMTAAFAIVSALLAARTTGMGRAIDVSMLDSTIVALGWVVSNYLLAGVTPAPIGNENMTAAPSGTFRTGDGPLNIAANRQQQFETLCRVIDRIDLASDPRFAEREARKANRAALNAEIEASLVTQPAEAWERTLNEVGVPAGRVMSIPDILAHPQIAGRRLIQQLDSSVDGIDRLSVVRAGYRLSDCEPAAGWAPPTLGADTDGLLQEIGVTAADRKNFRDSGVI
ncbi:CoA transferase [Antarcticimicrobium luteum]|uniref:CoA transferase n=1 Tax=Antarcticimicrobium luteum TaxID=2547397 RepID=A0A4R5V1R7_9RHOB|nr:CoA transferase [Antarcticimicrobium luteum]